MNEFLSNYGALILVAGLIILAYVIKNSKQLQAGLKEVKEHNQWMPIFIEVLKLADNAYCELVKYPFDNYEDFRDGIYELIVAMSNTLDPLPDETIDQEIIANILESELFKASLDRTTARLYETYKIERMQIEGLEYDHDDFPIEESTQYEEGDA